MSNSTTSRMNNINKRMNSRLATNWLLASIAILLLWIEVIGLGLLKQAVEVNGRLDAIDQSTSRIGSSAARMR